MQFYKLTAIVNFGLMPVPFDCPLTQQFRFSLKPLPIRGGLLIRAVMMKVAAEVLLGTWVTSAVILLTWMLVK